MLEEWLTAAIAEAGVEVPPGLDSEAVVVLVLDLARDAAHEIARPAAPLAAFAAGWWLGRSGGGVGELEEVVVKLAGRARRFGAERQGQGTE